MALKNEQDLNRQVLLLRFLSAIKALKETGERFLVLKGPVYDLLGGPARNYHHFTDLDIFPLGDVSAFAAALAKTGRFIPEIDPGRKNYTDLEQVQWMDTASGQIVDLHHQLFYPLIGNKGKELDRKLSAYVLEKELGGVSFFVPDPVLNVFFLLLHGEKHYWRREKDRVNYLYFKNSLASPELTEYEKLIRRTGCMTIYRVTEDLLHGKDGDTAKERYCIKYIRQVWGCNDHDSMTAMWRPGQIVYQFYISPAFGVFLLRLRNRLLPVLTPAAYTYNSWGGPWLRVVHLLRMLRIVPVYKSNRKWWQLLKDFGYPPPPYTGR